MRPHPDRLVHAPRDEVVAVGMPLYHVNVLLMPGVNPNGVGVLEIPQFGSTVHGPRDHVRAQPVYIHAPDGVGVSLVHGSVGQRLEVPESERGVLAAGQKVSPSPRRSRGRCRRRCGDERRRINRSGVTPQRSTVAKELRCLIALFLIFLSFVAKVTSQQDILMRPHLCRI